MSGLLALVRGAGIGEQARRLNVVGFVVLVLFAGVARGGDFKQVQVDAALEDARAGLRRQVMEMPLAPGVTVGQQAEATGSGVELAGVIRLAKSLGEERWVSPHICQVRMEMGAGPLGEILLRGAQAHADRTLVKPEILRSEIQNWGNLTLLAVGSSVTGTGLDEVSAGSVAAWKGVDAAGRLAAVTAAHEEAVGKILDSVAELKLVRPTVEALPVIGVDFHDDLTVTLEVVADHGLMMEALTAGADKSTDWKKVEAEVDAISPMVSGQGMVAQKELVVSTAIFLTTPVWVDQQIQAEGIASGGSTALKTARVAETVATADLRRQVLALAVSPGPTIGDVVAGHPQLAAAVEEALKQAHTFNVEYRADGSVLVRVNLSLREVWRGIRGGG